MKKNMNMNEQSMGAPQTGGGSGMWFYKFGCINDGVNGLKKVTTDRGSEFVHTSQDGTRTFLFNDDIQKPNTELVKKVMSVNPKIKHIGKGTKMVGKTQEDVVFYCVGPIRDGLRIVGANDTVEPPLPPKEPNKGTQPVAAVNESSENKMLSEEILRIKNVMGKIL